MMEAPLFAHPSLSAPLSSFHVICLVSQKCKTESIGFDLPAENSGFYVEI